MPATTPLPHPSPPGGPARRAYPLFLTGLGCWFTAWGMQTVLFQWLVVEELGASAARVGTAQMALLLPSLFFLLVGGASADRFDRRRSLMLLHTLAAVAAASLALLVLGGRLHYATLIGFAFLQGSVQAFVIPTREAQLSDVVRTRVSRAVAGLTMVQHSGQALGAFVAGTAGVVGAAPALGFQAVVLLLGALPMQRLPRGEPRTHPRPPLHLRELRPGLLEVARSPILRAVMLLNVSVGLTFVGTYLVLLPLLVRELYGGGSEKMGTLAATLPLGSILVNVWILMRGGLARQGLSLLLGQGLAGLALGGLALGMPFWGAVAATFTWGVGAAFAINASRTLFQEHSTEAHRGRVLSVYALSILGTGPLGALAAGALAEAFGTLATLGLQSAAMTLLILATLVFTRVRQFR